MNGLALITGGQKGIGLGIARALKIAGWRLALVSSSSEANEEVQSALDELGEEARYYTHDLRNVETISALLDRIESVQGPVQSLINNAGVSAPVRGDMLDIAPDNYQFVMDVNLRGAFFLSQQVARRMLAGSDDRYRSIVFVTSVSADMVSIERAEYCLSKASASMMAQLYAARLAGEGIGVFEVRPGIIETGMTAGVKDKYTARIESGLVPAARWGQPEDVGAAILPLVNGQMGFASGSMLAVDGGLSIHRL